MADMSDRRRFSLGYFFIFISLCLVVLGLIWRPVGGTQRDAVMVAFVAAFLAFAFSAALGGMFNQLKAGIRVGVVIGVIVFLPLITFAITGSV